MINIIDKSHDMYQIVPSPHFDHTLAMDIGYPPMRTLTSLDDFAARSSHPRKGFTVVWLLS